MRGDDQKQAGMFSYLTLAQRIPADHLARQIRVLVDRALARMVAAEATMAATAAEREAALKDKRRPEQKITLGADTPYQKEKFVQHLRDWEVAPPSANTPKAAMWARTAWRTRSGRTYGGRSVNASAS